MNRKREDKLNMCWLLDSSIDSRETLHAEVTECLALSGDGSADSGQVRGKKGHHQRVVSINSVR